MGEDSEARDEGAAGTASSPGAASACSSFALAPATSAPAGPVVAATPAAPPPHHLVVNARRGGSGLGYEAWRRTPAVKSPPQRRQQLLAPAPAVPVRTEDAEHQHVPTVCYRFLSKGGPG